MAIKYKWLAGHLREQLPDYTANGIHRLPTEAAISQRYKVSRQTVRQALQFITVSSADRVLEAALLPAGDATETISVPAAPALPIPAPKTRRKPGIRQ